MTTREHEFDETGFGPCKGCGKYVEQLMEERYCSPQFDTLMEYKPTCPQCKKELDVNKQYNSCNECECCFCSWECRNQFHERQNLQHNFNKELE